MKKEVFLLAYGTRPEYLKIKPLITEFKKVGVDYKILFTGQHVNIGQFEYDYIINIDELANAIAKELEGYTEEVTNDILIDKKSIEEYLKMVAPLPLRHRLTRM